MASIRRRPCLGQALVVVLMLAASTAARGATYVVGGPNTLPSDACSSFTTYPSPFESITLTETAGVLYNAGQRCLNGRNGMWEICPEWFSGSNATRLQKALFAAAQVHAASGEQVVVDLKTGTYLVDVSQFMCRYTTLYGQGRAATTLRATAGINLVVPHDHTELRHFGVDGNRGNLPPGQTEGAGFLLNFNSSLLDDVQIKNSSQGVAVNGSYNTIQNFNTDSNTYRGVNISAGAHDNVVASFSADGNGHAGILIGHTANHNTVTGGTISHTADAALWVHFAANDNLLENISISTAQNPSSYGIVLWNSRRNTFRNINIREYKTGALVRADDILTLLLPYGCAQPGPGGVPQLACSNGQPTNPSCYWACGYDDADTYGNVFDQLNVAYATPDLPDTVGIQLNTDTPNANLRKVRDNPITNLLVANTRYGLLHDEATPGTVLTHQATAPIGYWGYDHVWVPNNRVVKSYWDFTSAAAQHPNFPEAWGIDDNVATAWSSAMLTQFTSTYYAAWPSVYMNPVRRLNLFARLQANGQPQAFPKSYEVYITDPGNTQWNYVSTFSVQPDHGVASVTLGGPFQTWGVFIRATELTTDTFGNFYFQLADIEMQPW